MDKKTLSAFMASICLTLGLGLSPLSYADDISPSTSTMLIEKGDQKESAVSEVNASAQGKLDINSATLDELMTLKGIGKAGVSEMRALRGSVNLSKILFITSRHASVKATPLSLQIMEFI